MLVVHAWLGDLCWHVMFVDVVIDVWLYAVNCGVCVLSCYCVCDCVMVWLWLGVGCCSMNIVGVCVGLLVLCY